jgi:hypothetical protein
LLFFVLWRERHPVSKEGEVCRGRMDDKKRGQRAVITSLGLCHYPRWRGWGGGGGATHVYVEPAVILLADIGNFRYGIEGTDDRRTRGRVHKEGDVTLGPALEDELLESPGYHASALVARHHDAIVGAQAADRGA